MFYIHGIGSAYPETCIDSKLLSSIGEFENQESQAPHSFGIETRYSVLPVEYLEQTANQNPREALACAICSPSDLGTRAAEQALEFAGISAEQIGLILGAGSTPYQTTPSEAQRIGKQLGLRVPAYDLFCGAADFALCCHVLGNWKTERVPEYVLWVSSNCPTLKVNYRKGHERFLLGDSAVAVVLSAKHSGPLRLRTTGFFCDASRSQDFRFPLYGHAEFDSSLVDWTRSCLRHLVYQVQSLAPEIDFSESVLIGSQLGAHVDFDELGVLEAARIISNAKTRGYSIGSSTLSALADEWQSLRDMQQIVCLLAGAGSSSGLAVFDRYQGE